MRREHLKVGMIVVSNGVRGQICTIYKAVEWVQVIAFPQDVGGLDSRKYQRWPMSDIHTTIERQ